MSGVPDSWLLGKADVGERERVQRGLEEATRQARELGGEMARMNQDLKGLNEQAEETHRKLEEVADRIIAEKGPGWQKLKLVRERDQARAALREVRPRVALGVCSWCAKTAPNACKCGPDELKAQADAARAALRDLAGELEARAKKSASVASGMTVSYGDQMAQETLLRLKVEEETFSEARDLAQQRLDELEGLGE